MSEPATLYTGARGAIWLTGGDGLDFLHRLTTAATAGLLPGSGAATLLLTDAGRVIDLLRVYSGTDGLLLITTTAESAGPVAAHLRSHALYGDDVRVTDATSQVRVLTLARPPRAEVLHVLGLPAPAADDAGRRAVWLRSGWGGDEVWLLTSPSVAGRPETESSPSADDEDPNPSDCDFVVPVARAGELATLLGATLSAGYDGFRVARRLPAYGAELGTAAAGNPHELGLMALVDSTKGCYVGQEVVARLETYDKVQRALVAVSGTGLAAGFHLRRSEGRGRPGIVTTAPPGSGTALGFASLPVAVGDELEVSNGRSAAGTATVVWRAGS